MKITVKDSKRCNIVGYTLNLFHELAIRLCFRCLRLENPFVPIGWNVIMAPTTGKKKPDHPTGVKGPIFYEGSVNKVESHVCVCVCVCDM